jgi:Tfp pilus assembly protein PilN
VSQINFLPQTFVQQRACRRRVFRQGAMVVSIVVLMAMWYVSSRGRVEALERVLQLQLAQVQEAKDQLAQLTKLRSEYRSLANQARIQHDLVQPVAYTPVIAVIASLMPDSLTLTKLSMQGQTAKPAPAQKPADKSGAESRKARPAAPPAEPNVLHIALEGLAPSDVQIADFVGKLTDHPLFTNVKMLYSRTAEVRSVVTREFRIEMEVSLDCRYEPVGGAGGVAHAD